MRPILIRLIAGVVILLFLGTPLLAYYRDVSRPSYAAENRISDYGPDRDEGGWEQPVTKGGVPHFGKWDTLIDLIGSSSFAGGWTIQFLMRGLQLRNMDADVVRNETEQSQAVTEGRTASTK